MHFVFRSYYLYGQRNFLVVNDVFGASLYTSTLATAQNTMAAMSKYGFLNIYFGGAVVPRSTRLGRREICSIGLSGASIRLIIFSATSSPICW